MEAIKKRINLGIGYISSAILAVMVVMSVWQVFTRYVLNSPSTISEEFLRYSLIWVSMLGAAYAFGNKKHLAIELFVDKLPKSKSLPVHILIEVIILAFAMIVMIIGGLKTVDLTMAQSSAALGIPMGFIYLALPVSGTFIIGYSAISIFEKVKNDKEDMHNEEVKDVKKTKQTRVGA